MRWGSRLRSWFSRERACRHVLVFQPGKVGSSSLTATLKASAPGLTVRQIHFLAPWRIDRFREIMALPDTPPDYRIVVGKLVQDAEESLELLRSAQPGEVAVVSGFRDPLDRDLSAFAQNFPFFLPELTFEVDRLEEETVRVSAAFEALWRAVRSIPADAPVGSLSFRQAQGRWLLVDSCLEWFERDFCPPLGIDYRALKPKRAPWIRLYRQGIHILLYRYETLREHMRPLLEQLPLEAWRPVDRNVSATKKYGPLLRRWRETWRPDPAMAAWFYESEFYRRFYPGGTPRFAPRASRGL